MPEPTRTIDTAQEFLADFAAWSEFGATEHGGLHRLAGGIEHGEARRWLVRRIHDVGGHVRVDPVGNVYGLFDWLPEAPYVLIGSHSDSQPRAGRFDGAYGVLAALHAATAIRRMVENGELVPALNLAVVDWFNEEGARFQPSLMGSGVHIGKFSERQVLETADLSGITVGDALAAIGFGGHDERPATAAYAEVHIEQGRILEDEGVDIGVVTANWAVYKYTVVVRGDQAHTGATSMADRRDALVGAARVVLAVNDIPERFAADTVLSAIGRFVIEPNSPVVVPSRVTIDVDIRAMDGDVLDRAHQQFVDEIMRLDGIGGVEVDIAGAVLRPSTEYPPSGVALAQETAAGLGLTSKPMLTRAGHDSVNLKDAVPTVMLFVPSVDGISHSERELTADADLINGMRMLSGVAARLVGGEFAGPGAEENSR